MSHLQAALHTLSRPRAGVGALLLALLVVLSMPAENVSAAQEPEPEQRAKAAFARGEAALDAGRLEDAIAAFREVADFAPQDPGVRFRLGQALFLNGDAESIEHLEAARDSTGARPEVVFLLAQAYLAHERYEQAATALGLVESAAPGVPDVALARGELCYLVGRFGGAVDHLRRAVEMGPSGWGPPLYRLGLTLVADRRWNEAARWLGQAASAEPRDPEIWLLLGTARNRAGDPTGALEAFERAVAVAPDSIPARLVLAERHDFTDRVPELMEQVDAVLRLDPDEPTALLHRANRAALEGRTEEALADLETMLTGTEAPQASGRATGRRVTSRERQAEARRRRIDLLARLGRRAEALEAARELVRDEPEFADGHFVLGNLLLRAGNDEGRGHLERFKAMSDARTHRRLGEGFLETTDDPGLAEAEFQAALTAWPADRSAMLGLARVRRLQGRHEEALALLDAVRGAPGTAGDWTREVILSLAGAGRTDEALEAWRQAREQGVPLGPEIGPAVYRADYGCS